MFGIQKENSLVLSNDLRLIGLFLEGGMVIPQEMKITMDIKKHNGLISLIVLEIHHILFRNNEFHFIDKNLNSLTINMVDIKIMRLKVE